MKLTGYSEFTRDIELVSYADMSNDDEIKYKYLGWLNDLDVVTPICSEELMQTKQLDFIEGSFRRFTREECQGFFIKYLPADAFVGTIKLDKINLKNRSGELGIMIGEKTFWNRQIGTKASLILVKYAFEKLDLNKVWGGTDESNSAMQKLFLKMGFQQEGRFRQVGYLNGRKSDCIYYGLLKSEYAQS